LDGAGSAASFAGPKDVALDPTGHTLYVVDTANCEIRAIDLTVSPAMVSTLAGSTTCGYADGTGTAAQFNMPYSLATDNKGNIYVADTYNYVIRQIDPASKAVTTLAGSASQGYIEGSGASALFNAPLFVRVRDTAMIHSPRVSDGPGIAYETKLGANDAIRQVDVLYATATPTATVTPTPTATITSTPLRTATATKQQY